MKDEIRSYLMDHFDGRGNDYHETIESFEIDDNQVIIETWISFSVNIDLVDHNLENIEAIVENVKEELSTNGTLDLIAENYVCGFYCNFFEGLTHEDFLQNADIEISPSRSIGFIFLPMSYNMDLGEIEQMYIDYKKCA